jgi:phosphohistidine phosphatase SixA
MTIKESSENSIPLAPVLIIMRHGARSFEGDQLSVEGRKQASGLKETLKTMQIPMPTEISVSPKNRTRATVATLATELALPVSIVGALDERTGAETQSMFEDRVKQYLESCNSWATSSLGKQPSTRAVRLLCSHLDWLEAAALFIASSENDFDRSEPWPPLKIRAYIFKDEIWERMKVEEA